MVSRRGGSKKRKTGGLGRPKQQPKPEIIIEYVPVQPEGEDDGLIKSGPMGPVEPIDPETAVPMPLPEVARQEFASVDDWVKKAKDQMKKS